MGGYSIIICAIYTTGRGLQRPALGNGEMKTRMGLPRTHRYAISVSGWRPLEFKPPDLPFGQHHTQRARDRNARAPLLRGRSKSGFPRRQHRPTAAPGLRVWGMRRSPPAAIAARGQRKGTGRAPAARDHDQPAGACNLDRSRGLLFAFMYTPMDTTMPMGMAPPAPMMMRPLSVQECAAMRAGAAVRSFPLLGTHRMRFLVCGAQLPIHDEHPQQL